MSRFLGKLLLRGAVALLVVVVVVLGYVLLAYPPDIPAPEVTLARGPEQLERGRYLVEHVALCLDCHSERDWRYWGGPVVRRTRGGGARVEFFGSPVANSANLTPVGLGDWSDGEVIRAITSGLKKDGRAVHPLMPFDTYARFTREDVHAIVAYLRTLDPVERVLPESGGPIRLIGRLLPSPWEPPRPVDPTDPVARGEYLATVAECPICHSADLGGGRLHEIPDRGGARRAPNISADVATGIGGLSRENFIGVFRSFGTAESRRIPLPDDRVGTPMPWQRYAGMTDEDLGAIYDYIMSRPPVSRRVEPFARLPGEPTMDG